MECHSEQYINVVVKVRTLGTEDSGRLGDLTSEVKLPSPFTSVDTSVRFGERTLITSERETIKDYKRLAAHSPNRSINQKMLVRARGKETDSRRSTTIRRSFGENWM